MKYKISTIGPAIYSILGIRDVEENNKSYFTAICNNGFTTLISFYTFKTKVFFKLNTLDQYLSLCIRDQ